MVDVDPNKLAVAVESKTTPGTTSRESADGLSARSM
jgi:hypothetical protein